MEIKEGRSRGLYIQKKRISHPILKPIYNLHNALLFSRYDQCICMVSGISQIISYILEKSAPPPWPIPPLHEPNLLVDNKSIQSLECMVLTGDILWFLATWVYACARIVWDFLYLAHLAHIYIYFLFLLKVKKNIQK